MKNTLWTFGDSMTYGFGCNSACSSDVAVNYLPFKKEGDDIWSNHLGKLLNYNVKNLGKNAASNDYIFDLIIDNYDFIQSNDIVIINTTLYGRMEVPFETGTYNILSGYEGEKVNPNTGLTDRDSQLFGIKIQTKEENDEKIQTLVNFQYYFSNHEFYKIRHKKRFEFIKNLFIKEKKIKFFYMWSLEDDDGIYASFQTITQATNGLVNDPHFSFNGHFNFAHFLYALMDKKRMI